MHLDIVTQVRSITHPTRSVPFPQCGGELSGLAFRLQEHPLHGPPTAQDLAGVQEAGAQLVR